MMNLRQYKVWPAKPKNGSVEPEEAAIRFENLCKAPGAILDEKGDCPKYRQRVAVHKGDFIMTRDSQQTIRSVQAKGRENRKATSEDLEKAPAKLQSQNDYLKEAVDRGRMAQRLPAGKAAAMEDLEEGGVSGALSSVGRAAMNMGALEDVFMLEEEDNSDPDAAAEEQGVKRKEKDDDIVSEATARQAKRTRVARAVWNQRDEKLIGEIDKHALWMGTTKKAFEESLKEIQSIKKDIVGAALPDLKQRIAPDLIQLENRERAVQVGVVSRGAENCFERRSCAFR